MTGNQSIVTGFQTLNILAVDFETKDRQSRGVIIDQYRDPCAQGSHLETFRVFASCLLSENTQSSGWDIKILRKLEQRTRRMFYSLETT